MSSKSKYEVEVIFGSDHAGFELKQKLCSHLMQNKIITAAYDAGCFTNNRVDYPDYTKNVAMMMTKSTFKHTSSCKVYRHRNSFLRLVIPRV